MRKRSINPALWICLLVLATVRAAQAADLDAARDHYRKTHYQEVVRILDTGREMVAEAYELIGRAYYHLGDYKKSTDFLEKATQLEPKNSEYFDWLGKIYGRRAETSSFLTAWDHAGKCHRNFERAIELDPKNLEAIDDLFEYALNAPGFVGGGIDKAMATAERTRELNPAKYHSLQARIAEKQKDYAWEEKQLKMALEIAPTNFGRILDMAEYLSRRGRFAESEAFFERARKVAPESAELKFEHAKTYIESGRNREEAKKLLKEYMESALTPDDPPRSEAEELLKKAARS